MTVWRDNTNGQRTGRQMEDQSYILPSGAVLPSLPDALYPLGIAFRLTTNQSLWVNNAGSWVRISSTSDIDAREFGVTGVAATDQTAALQAAIDACQAMVISNLYGAPVLRLPPGQITLTSTIQWKSCSVAGSWPNNGTRIVWNGAGGGTVFTKWATDHAGNKSFCMMENVNFRSGTAEPATFLDLTANAGLVDWGFRLQNIHFNSCTSDAIKMNQWVNCHWQDLRFDHIGGYAIRMTSGASQNLSSFRLDGFTYDHARASGPGGGVIMIDNSADATNLGVFELANGRIEINTAWAAAGTAGTGAASLRGVVVLRESNSPVATRELGLELRNITYADATGMADDVLLYRDSSNLTGSASLLWRNVRANNMSAVIGGSWPSFFKAPLVGDLTSTGAMNTQSGAAGMTLGVGSRIYSSTGSPESVVTAPVGSLFLRTDGGANTTMYVKESGTGNTGWIAK